MKLKNIFFNKWIVIMLVVSTLIIVGLRITDSKQISMPIMESIEMPMDDYKSTPIQIEIIEKEKPFDWKEMISWVIGGLNGVVLLVMNIRNIRKK